MTTKELTSHRIELQRAIFNSWDYQKKKNVWIDKLSFVLANESFVQAERDHIQLLINHIDENYFQDKNIRENLNSRSRFAREWINYALYQLDWTKEYVAFIVYRLYTSQDQFEAELSKLSSINADATTDSEGDCDCNVSADFCGTVDCRSQGCTTVPSGCGWLWSMPCDGSCY